MPIRYIPIDPIILRGQAVLGGFTRTLRYAGDQKAASVWRAVCLCMKPPRKRLSSQSRRKPQPQRQRLRPT